MFVVGKNLKKEDSRLKNPKIIYENFSSNLNTTMEIGVIFLSGIYIMNS